MLAGFVRHKWFGLLLLGWIGVQVFLAAGKQFEHDEVCSLLSAAGRAGEAKEIINRPGLVEVRAGELAALTVPGGNLAGFYRGQARYDVHPPLFFLLLRFALRGGAGPAATVILLPLFISALAKAALYLLSSRFLSMPWRLLPPALSMFSVPAVYYASELRPYCLMELLFVLMLLAAARAAKDPESCPRWIMPGAMGAVIGLGLLTQYLFAFAAAAVSLSLLLIKPMREKKAFLRLCLANLTGLAIFSAWAPAFLDQIGRQAGREFTGGMGLPAALALIAQIISSFFFYTSAAVITLPGLIILAAILAGTFRPPAKWLAALAGSVFLLCLGLPLFLHRLGILSVEHLMDPKYFFHLSPVFYILAAAGAGAMKPRALGWAAAASILLAAGLGLVSTVSSERAIRAAGPSSLSPLPSIVKAIDRETSGNYAAVSDVRNFATVVAARSLPPGNTLLIAECDELPALLPPWLEKNKPGRVVFLHRLSPGETGPSPCLDQVFQGARGGYEVLISNLAIKSWKISVLGRKGP